MTKCRNSVFALLALSYFTSIAAMEIFSWGSFLIALCIVVMNKDWRPKTWKVGADIALWGFFALTTLGAFLFAPDQKEVIDMIGYVRWIFLLYAYAYLLKLDQKPLHSWATAAIAVGVGLASFYGLLQFMFGFDPVHAHKPQVLQAAGAFFRSVGFFSQSLTYAYCMGMGGLLLLGLSWQQISEWKKRLYICIGLFSIVGMLVSLSRGAWLAGAFCFLGLALNYWGLRRIWPILVTMALGIVLVFSFNAPMRARLMSVTSSTNHSNNVRVSLWKANLAMAKDNPWLGVGLSRNKYQLLDYYKKVGIENETFIGHAHNNLIQILVGTGVFGLLCYLWFSGFFLYAAWKVWKTQTAVAGLGLGAFWAQLFVQLGGLTECNFTDGEVNHLLVFIWAAVAASYALSVDSKQPLREA